MGSIQDPLVPLSDCSQKDITDDGSGSIFACLCNTDFCNDDISSLGDTTTKKVIITTTRKPTTRRNFPPRRLPTPTPGRNAVGEEPRSPQIKTERQKAPKKLCPPGFDKVGGKCYFVSSERVGWIEARKKCEEKGTILLSIQSRSEESNVLEYVVSLSNRRRADYWLAGNDIEEEGEWTWAKLATPVPQFGWTEEPYDSYEENCLAWTVTKSTRDNRAGWHGASCCNNLRYICEDL